MKVYVTGGTGLVGSNVVKVAVERHKAHVFATVRTRKPNPPVDCAYGTVDVHDRDQVLQSVLAFRPNVIVHCAVVNDLPLIYQDRALGWRSYVDSTRYLTEAANEVEAKMILISSDWVFDGTQAMADEATPPNPINYYGVLKVAGETLVATMGRNWAVARVAGVNGVHWARPELLLSQNVGFGNLAVAAAKALAVGQTFTVWEGQVNMRGTPTLATEIGEMIVRIVETDGRGIFHCCGGESTTRLELARTTANVFGLDPDLIRIGPPDPADPAVLAGIPIPKDTSLSCSYTAELLAHTPLSLRQALGKLRKHVETGQN